MLSLSKVLYLLAYTILYITHIFDTCHKFTEAVLWRLAVCDVVVINFKKVRIAVRNKWVVTRSVRRIIKVYTPEIVVFVAGSSRSKHGQPTAVGLSKLGLR